ncbi:hypothetical protein ACNPK2_17795, partial [Acinetobacter baumannii]|uniref:hypothetical protein n=1 Tax=Acinetobacter baumannii TaxID=470 RepID=UPI003D12F325
LLIIIWLLKLSHLMFEFADHSKGSLWDNPVLLDLKGNIIKNGNKEILKNSKKGKAISANAVYGNE